MEKLSLLQYCDYFLKAQQKLFEKKRISKGTYVTYRVRKRNLSEFLYTHDLGCILPEEVHVRLIRKFEIWLKTEKGHSVNYAIKNIQLLDRILDIVLEDEGIKSNPLRLYEYKYCTKQKIVCLNQHELEQLEDFEFEHKRLQKAADFFIFQCHTGFSYSTTCAFKFYKHVIKGPEGVEYIYMNRTKTDEITYLPLLPGARRILDKYNYKIPVMSIQAMNRAMKEIASILKIRKDLTTHVARKTFADTMHNEYFVPLSTVARMLGHSTEATTQKYYVKTSIRKVHHDMQVVIQKFA